MLKIEVKSDASGMKVILSGSHNRLPVYQVLETQDDGLLSPKALEQGLRENEKRSRARQDVSE